MRTEVTEVMIKFKDLPNKWKNIEKKYTYIRALIRFFKDINLTGINF